MWFFKNKYNKLKREDVVSALISLQEKEKELDDSIEQKQKQIYNLTERGKKETDRSMKILLAKKINSLKQSRENDMQRILYLLYNQNLMEKLKDALDDKNFIASTSGLDMNKLLADQSGLARFLNTALNTKVKAEEIMTSADEVFNQVASVYEPNQAIYGVNKGDDDLLAMFETTDSLSDTDLDSIDDTISKEKDLLT